jgi:LytS/YehU family sensor histidine kinase
MDNFFARLALSQDRSYWIGRHAIFWFICWMFMGFIYGFYYSGGSNTTNFSTSYVESLIYLPQHMILSYGIIYYILPSQVFRGRYWQAIMGVFLLIVVVAIMSPLISKFVIIPLRQASMAHLKNAPLHFSFMAGLRGSMTIAGFAVAIKLVKVWYNKKVDNDRLEKANLSAELEILKGQLNPHFMFNTLNSIYALALKKAANTPDAILKLSQLMRYMLTECTAPTIALRKEILVITDYIALEKTRFENRIDLDIQVHGDLENKKIAPLLLLPFIENSFKHGANEMIDQAWISLDLQVSDDTLKFKLINGKASTKNIAESNHFGLTNVKRRLALLYPEAHRLKLTEDDDTFIAYLELELNKIKTN